MEQKNFIPIGIVEMVWEYEPFGNENRRAYYEFYIPSEVNYNYGGQFCNKFAFLENDNVYSVELVESIKFKFEELEYDSSRKLHKTRILNEIIYLNDEQLEKIKKIIVKNNLLPSID